MQSHPDPFADPELRERMAKLLRLLASDAAGEADAARTALLRLLAKHGASLDDLTQRLLGPAPDDMPALRIGLVAAERRAGLAEAASRAALAETERLRSSATLLRVVAIAGGGATALLLALVLLPSTGNGGYGSPAPPTPASAVPIVPPVVPAPPPSPPQPPEPPPAIPSPPLPAPSPAEPAPAPARQPIAAGRHGQVVAPEGVLLRLDPVPGVPAVALLPQGTKVIIDQAFPMLGTDWMQVRSAQGAGFVPASTIRPE